jgi:hypothetical protein
MSEADKLIERLERETGQRIDDPDSASFAGLFGAVARIMEQSQHEDHDDVVAGLLILHQLNPEYQNEQERRKLIAGMLSGGMSPDTIRQLWS